jgi:GxxExxY protein
MDADDTGVNRATECIIGCAFRVLNTLGIGFFEKNYENALAHELRKAGLTVAQQQGVTVIYDGINIGDYVVDLLVEGTLIVELKTVKVLDNSHIAQCLNYLKATGLHLCLLLNFGNSRLEIRRIVNSL